MVRRASKSKLKWRMPTCTPDELPTRYGPQLNNLVSMALGERFIWDQATSNFYASLCSNLKIYSWKRKVDQVRDTLLSIRSVDWDDIYQEALISLLDSYHLYISKMRRCRFSTYILIHIPRKLAAIMAEYIRVEKGDNYCPTFSEEYWMDDPEKLTVNLGWVFLREKRGTFSNLTTFQKYLLYLRYNKDMTVREISELTNRNLKLLELDFGYINKLLSPNATD